MDQLNAMFLADPSTGELLLGTGSTGMAVVLFTGRINGQKFFQTPIDRHVQRRTAQALPVEY
jgi:hypothetical protein